MSTASSLADLAKGLSNFDGGLQAFLKQREQQQNENDKVLAERDFHANNQEGYADGVAAGRIPAQASRAYMESYKNTQGDVAGQQMLAKFKVAYDGWDGKGSADPQKFNDFLGTFIKSNLQGPDAADPGVLRGLLPRLRELANNGMAAHIADVSNETKRKSVLVAGAQADMVIEDGYKAEKPDNKAIIATIHALRDGKLKAGENEEKLDHAYIDAIVSQAQQRGEAGRSLLEEFKNAQVPGKDYTWGNTPYGREKIISAIDAIDKKERQDQVASKQARLEANKQALDAWTRKTLDALSKDPSVPVPEEVIKEGEKYDADARVKVIDWRNKLLNSTATSDPNAMRDLSWEIINGGGVAAVRRYMEAGHIKSKEDLVSAYKFATEMEANKDRVSKVLSNGTVVNTLSALKQRLTPSSDQVFFNPEQASDAALSAMHDFRMMVIEWSAKNPNASALETEKAIGEMSALMMKRVGNSGSPMEANSYNRPADAPASPFGTPAAAPAAPAPQAAPQQPAPKPGAPNPGDAVPKAQQLPAPRIPLTPQQAPNIGQAMGWFQSLTPAEQAKAADAAKTSGKSLEEVVGRAYEMGIASGRIKKPEGEGTVKPSKSSMVDDGENPPVAPNPEVEREVASVFKALLDDKAPYNPKGQFTIAAIKNNPAAARLLDFIAGPESRGNYNAVFGNVGSTRDLSGMTLDQVIADAKARAKANGVSSATGRYQFMSYTLTDLKKELGMSGSERFTPELQDNLALALMERRGYSQWMAGKLTTEQFANNLAKEWASLPNMATGRSHYAGDGVNKSLVTPQKVAGVLEQAKGLRYAKATVSDADTIPANSGATGRYGPNDVYAKFPEAEVNDMIRWNPDPVGNHERNLKSVKAPLQRIFEQAQKDNPGLKMVVSSGLRDAAKQQVAKELGWSKTTESKHLHGNAMDVWPIGADGKVDIVKGGSPAQQKVRAALVAAAKKLGIATKIIEWDLPHVELAD